MGGPFHLASQDPVSCSFVILLQLSTKTKQNKTTTHSKGALGRPVINIMVIYLLTLNKEIFRFRALLLSLITGQHCSCGTERCRAAVLVGNAGVALGTVAPSHGVWGRKAKLQVLAKCPFSCPELKTCYNVSLVIFRI